MPTPGFMPPLDPEREKLFTAVLGMPRPVLFVRFPEGGQLADRVKQHQEQQRAAMERKADEADQETLAQRAEAEGGAP